MQWISDDYWIGPFIPSRYHLTRAGTNLKSHQNVFVTVAASTEGQHRWVVNEHYVLTHMKQAIGIPKVYLFENTQFRTMLITNGLGASLQELYYFCGKQFSLNTVLQIAIQILTRLKHLHTHNFIHRSICPQSMFIGSSVKTMNIIHLTSFEISKRYRKPTNHKHILYSEMKKVRGPSHFISINCHLGIETSRRDDLQSLAYVLMKFIRAAGLPWEYGQYKNLSKIEKYNKIGEKKMDYSIEWICKGYHNIFVSFMNYTKTLRFDAKPDYKYWIKMFKDAMDKEKDTKLDWIVKIENIVHGYFRTLQKMFVSNNVYYRCCEDVILMTVVYTSFC